MSANALKVLEDALRLPENERADLAAQLLKSLDPEADTDVAAAWDAEVLRRLDELDKGLVKPVPWSEARQRIVGEDNGSARA
jgi:putative addiction module component (TIGR02574 family)